ncbi:MAG TPA: NADH-quinone oxidoreductase subunit D, partial [bacterium]|nr:NADH-quinone oxidoreductase subunit D [bacterium]
QYADLFSGNEIFLARAKGTGYLSAEEAIALSLSGVMLRASGVAYDVRKNKPYSIYPELDWQMAVSDRGDILGRYEVRWQEMIESLKMVEQCWAALQDMPGEIMGKVPKTIKPARSETYACIESARGELGIYLVANGDKNPYKLHFKSPGQINLQSVDPMCRGLPIADVVAALGSVDIVLGEVDK